MDHLKFILSRVLRRLLFPSLRSCKIDKTARVLPLSSLSDVEMGRYSYCGSNCVISNTTIGSFTSIADLVSIGRAEHPIDFVSMSPVFHEGRNVMRKSFSEHALPPRSRTVIGNDVWIGQGAMVKAGVCIGNGAVIGMGSIVTRDVPAYAIYAGNPAKIVRFRFEEEIRDKLESTGWWNWDNEKLARMAKDFADVSKFLARSLP